MDSNKNRSIVSKWISLLLLLLLPSSSLFPENRYMGGTVFHSLHACVCVCACMHIHGIRTGTVKLRFNVPTFSAIPDLVMIFFHVPTIAPYKQCNLHLMKTLI
jgi:aminopeptidase-like protein